MRRQPMSIRSKILVMLLTILLLLYLMVSAVWYRNATEMAEMYLSDISESMMKDAYNAFEYVLMDTTYMITMISLNEEQIIVPTANINKIELNENGQLGIDYLENKRIIKEYLSSMNGYKYYIVGIGVTSKNGYIFQTSHIVQNSDELFSMIADIDSDKIGNSMMMMKPVYAEGTWISLKSNYVVPAVRAIRDTRQNIIGYTVLYFDYSVIESMFSNNLPENSKFQVVDQENNIIFSNCGDEIMDLGHPESHYVYSTYAAPKVGWTFIMAINSDPILSEVTKTLTFTAVIVIGIFLLAIVAGVIISSRITNNIKVLSTSMNQVAKGDMTVQRKIKSRDEIGQMEYTFNHMVLRIRELMDTVAEDEKQKRLVEMAFLQAQINPHFISNTLNIVAWMAKIQHAESIIPLTNALNNLLRAAMRKGDDLIPLSEEMSHVNSFLELVEYSGSYEFKVDLQIDPDLEKLYVLRFILQPIVENAIYHGLKTSLGHEGCITIAARTNEDCLEITVEDNGQGMTDMQMENVMHGEKTIPHGFNGIGIHNVVERIQLFFGEKYGLRYESELNVYTKAILTLPIIDKKAEGINEQD